jgi:streptomycin 6-kinase
LIVPAQLAAACLKTTERGDWLARLPEVLADLERRWSLKLGDPFLGDEVSCSWVAGVVLSDGTSAVLKVGMPHMEGADEIEGLRFWNGDPMVRLLEADDGLGAMLLERCLPGTALRALPESEQDVVIARLLRRLWRRPPALNSFRPLWRMTEYWSQETLADQDRWPDPGLVQDGLRLFTELARSTPEDVLLATDLHAGNVLRAEREAWLAIDPKPFVGERAYDATQHLMNCKGRLRSNPDGTIRRFADLLGLDAERIRLWMFARAAAEPREDWADESWMEVARAVAP